MPQTYNSEIEAAPIACVLKDPSTFPIIEDIIGEDSFAWKPFGFIWKAIVNVVLSDSVPDIQTIVAELDRLGYLNAVTIFERNDIRGKEVLQYLRNSDVSVDNVESYASKVREFQSLRELDALGRFIQESVKESVSPIEILNSLDAKSGKISLGVGGTNTNIKDIKDVSAKNIESLKEIMAGKGNIIKTGIQAWDSLTRGLFPGRLYVVSGFSGDGKSTIAANIAYNIAIDPDNENPQTVFYMNFEMSAMEVNNRLAQRITGIDSLRIESGELTETELEKYAEALKILSGASGRVIFDDSPGITLPVLRSKIRKGVTSGAKVVIIDQLDQITISGSAGMSEPVRVNMVAYKIKEYCREFNVPIILLHQLNRSNDNNEARKMGKAAYDINTTALSQAGERPSDAVFIIRHSRDAKGEIRESFLKLAKHRQGKTSVQRIVFNAQYLRIEDSDNPNADNPEWYGDESEDEEYGI